MLSTEKKLIEKKYVHKQSMKNVFLYNMRRKFDNFYPGNFFESILAPLSDVEKKLILMNYIPVETKEVVFLKDDDTMHYMLKSIILTIDEQTAQSIRDTKSKDDQDFFFDLYHRDENGNRYVLTRDISEEEEKRILIIIDDKKHFVTDRLKADMAEIFEKIETMPKGDVVYANMHVNLAHEFFFEHPNEHVPGIMLLETFRQFCVAVNHMFGNVSVDNHQLVLECLDSKYFKYTELSVPIILKGYLKKYTWNKQGVWSFLDFETDILQNFKVTAHFRLYGQIISKKLFQRMRKKDKDKVVKYHRFNPLPEFAEHFTIKNKENQKYVDVDLVNISHSGFMLHSDFFNKITDINTFDFHLFSDDVGFITGTCEKVWQDENLARAGFKITEIANDDFNNLKESIARHCHIDESREIF